jgi:hypothetical protein
MRQATPLRRPADREARAVSVGLRVVRTRVGLQEL